MRFSVALENGVVQFPGVAKTVLGKGLKSLLKAGPVVSENPPEIASRTENENVIVGPGVEALLRAGKNGQATEGDVNWAVWHLYWPRVRFLLWASDGIVVLLSASALTFGGEQPGVAAILLSGLGFLAGAGLASLAIFGDAITAALGKGNIAAKGEDKEQTATTSNDQ